MVTMVQLVKDADRLILGQSLTMHLREFFKQAPEQCQNDPLLDCCCLNNFPGASAVNPATLLPDPDLEVLLHDCSGILVQVHSIRSDLWSTLLPGAAVIWHTEEESTWGQQSPPKRK